MMGELVINHVMPTAIFYQNQLAQNVLNLRMLGIEDDLVANTVTAIKKISEHVSNLQKEVTSMIETRKNAKGVGQVVFL